MRHVYFGILAGGSGERLWPLSTQEQPKQLLPFLDGESLLQSTIKRISPIAHKENIFIITNTLQEALVKQNASDSIGFIVTEPDKRNTGPAILLAAHSIYQKDPNAIIIFLTADHFIPEPEAFLTSIKRAIEYVSSNKKIALFGLMPTFPATGYGYIQAENTDEKIIINQPYKIKKFHEKPHKEDAKKYMTNNNMFWNMGVFAGQASAFIDEFKTCAPEIARAMLQYLENKVTYNQIPAESVDYAVMEKSSNTTLFPTDFEWHDVGNLYIFLQIQAKYAQQASPLISLDAHNNLVKSNKKIIACIGVNNLCIIETDDVLIVANNDKIDQVKTILHTLKEKNTQEVIF